VVEEVVTALFLPRVINVFAFFFNTTTDFGFIGRHNAKTCRTGACAFSFFWRSKHGKVAATTVKLSNRSFKDLGGKKVRKGSRITCAFD